MIDNRILQLVTPGVPVFAVYTKLEGSEHPRSWDEAYMRPCPALALYEPQDQVKRTFVGAVVVDELGFELPDGVNFLGYATSKEEAEARYFAIPEEQEG